MVFFKKFVCAHTLKKKYKIKFFNPKLKKKKRNQNFENVVKGLDQLLLIFIYLKAPKYSKYILLQLLHFEFWKQHKFAIYELLEKEPILLNEELGELHLSQLGRHLSSSHVKAQLSMIRQTFCLTPFVSQLQKDFEQRFCKQKKKKLDSEEELEYSGFSFFLILQKPNKNTFFKKYFGKKKEKWDEKADKRTQEKICFFLKTSFSGFCEESASLAQCQEEADNEFLRWSCNFEKQNWEQNVFELSSNLKEHFKKVNSYTVLEEEFQELFSENQNKFQNED